MTLTEIKTMRQACRAKVEDLLGRTSSRDMSTEETQLLSDLKAEGERLGSLESRYAVLESFDQPNTITRRQPIAITRESQKEAAIKAFDSFLRTGKMATDTPLQIQQSPIDAGLASAVPTEVVGNVTSLTGAIDLPSALGVREFPRDNTNPLVVPFEISPATATTYNEGAGATESHPDDFGSKTLTGKRYQALVKISLQSLSNVAFPLASVVTRSILTAMITAQNTAFAAAMKAAVQFNSSCYVDTSESSHDIHLALSKLKTGLDPIWWSKSNKFLLNPTDYQRVLDERPASGDGHPLFPVFDGTIFGHEVVVHSAVDRAYFGSFEVGAMRSQSPLFVQVLRELYSQSGLIGYSGYEYADFGFAAETTAAKQPIVFGSLDVAGS
jgi:HK97 family phage major capsid protein